MAKSKRKELEDDLKSRMSEKHLDSAVYQSKLQEYMEMYDHDRDLQRLSESVKDDPKMLKVYLNCTKEQRQIRLSMKQILNWMGINPQDEALRDKEKDYDL